MALDEVRKVRIRVADWRDWKEIQALRSQLQRPFDGGLYELLHWPTYHVHYAMGEGDPKVVGFTSVSLFPNYVAEDVGSFVVPESRGQKVASQLRLVQVRDLMEMGWHTLFVVADTDEYVNWAVKYMEQVGVLDDGSRYFVAPCADLMDRLLDDGVPAPHQLSPDNKARLGYKSGRAIQDLARLQALGLRQLHKELLRQEWINKD